MRSKLVSLVVVCFLGAFVYAANPDDYFKPNYKGFSPFVKCQADYLIDGGDYFEDLAKSIKAAKKEIIIAGWKIHPEVRLAKRGQDAETLISLLRDAIINRGVKVYVMFWNNAFLGFMGRDWMGMRVDEGIAQLTAIGASVLEHRGMGWTPTARWSQHQKTFIFDRQWAYVGGLDVAWGRYDSRSHMVHDSNREDPEDTDASHNKEYKPWHDMTARIVGHGAFYVSDNAIQRWRNYCNQMWIKTPAGCRPENVPPVMLAFDSPSSSSGWRQSQPSSSPNVSTPPPGEDIRDVVEKFDPLFAKEECQIVRSVGDWNTGVSTETSILNSWVQMISEAKHFIYIEQQYFSSIPYATNPVSTAILARLEQAIRAQQNFRVVVVLPLACEESHAVYPTQKTILFGPQSMWPRLQQIIDTLKNDPSQTPAFRNWLQSVKPEDYLSFYFLGTVNLKDDGYAVTGTFRQIFVHAKLLIVDDRLVNVGSANLNDRSFLGERDSEINLATRPAIPIPGTFDGKPFEKSEFASNFRLDLWSEHLTGQPGAIKEEWKDAIIDSTFHDIWRATAIRNTAILKKVFDIELPKLDIKKDFDTVEEGVFTRTYLSREDAGLMRQIQGHLFIYAPNVWGDDESALKSIIDSLPWLEPMLKSGKGDVSSKQHPLS